MKNICLVSLGCAKNLVDSEMILAMFPLDRYRLVNKPAEADLIIVNTCGFIGSAKQEAIDTILAMAEYPAKLVAVGCFVERNLEELKQAIPEVDLWVPLRNYASLHQQIGALLGEDDLLPISPLRRVIATSAHTAYLRISDGCDNFCSFCAIPYIRGRMHSRPLEEIVEEAKMLKEQGVKEISLVSQDPMHYGKDFPDATPRMSDLLRALDALGFFAIRLLYLYPEEILDSDLELIRDSRSILPYFDVPIQTASDPVLKAMNRHGDVEGMRQLFHKIRALMPKAVLRTTLISGFPGETEADHQATLNFLKEIRFDHLGDFPYSREEGTAAYQKKNQIPDAVKKARHDEIMALQREISYAQNQSRLGDIMEGIVIGYDQIRNKYLLRTYWNAPDGIDGNLYFASSSPLQDGDIVKVKIVKAFPYDLEGEIIAS